MHTRHADWTPRRAQRACDPDRRVQRAGHPSAVHRGLAHEAGFSNIIFWYAVHEVGSYKGRLRITSRVSCTHRSREALGEVVGDRSKIRASFFTGVFLFGVGEPARAHCFAQVHLTRFHSTCGIA